MFLLHGGEEHNPGGAADVINGQINQLKLNYLLKATAAARYKCYN